MLRFGRDATGRVSQLAYREIRAPRIAPGRAPTRDELAGFVAERVGGYKRPRAYEIRDELPRTDSGKLLKRVLRDEYWAGRASAV